MKTPCLIVLLAMLLPVTPARSAGDATTERLATFARLYGYVRYFHPSDAAAGLDWEKMALLGAREIVAMDGDARLVPVLADLLGPAAPTMTLQYELPAYNLPVPVPGGNMVAWQHRGVGIRDGTAYRSARTYRDETWEMAGSFGQVIDATPYRGMRFRWSAVLRTQVADEEAGARLYARVQRAGGRPGFYDDLAGGPVRNSDWTMYAVTGRIDDDAETLYVGGVLVGAGWLWIDGTELAVRADDGSWHPVPIDNPSFEVTELGPAGWFHAGRPYRYSIDSERAWHGTRSMAVAGRPPLVPGSLFAAPLSQGAELIRRIGNGPYLRLPLALNTEAAAIGVDSPALHELRDRLAALDENRMDRRILSVAGVIIAWNVMQHFYPYFDVVDVNWEAQLDRALDDALDDQAVEDSYETLSRLIAALDDGHGMVWHEFMRQQAQPPVRLRWIEQSAVVTGSDVPDDLQIGDVVLAVDGEPIDALLNRRVSLLSGTLRWKRFKALQRLSPGPPGSEVTLTVSRGGSPFDVVLKRGRPADGKRLLEPLDTAAPGIRYVDLTRAGSADIQAAIGELASADGLIVDMRGYPKGNDWLLAHMSNEALQSAEWNIPHIIYPDHEGTVGWSKDGRWLMAPRKPRLPERIVFLTDASAISYAESVMGIVEHYRLGDIVGEATAGANGNINPFPLPGGLRVYWTGMKVLKHDGSQHHLVGIRPTIPATRTIAGVRAGRDELLEVAIEALGRGGH